jgi:hypothetical protein
LDLQARERQKIKVSEDWSILFLILNRGGGLGKTILIAKKKRKRVYLFQYNPCIFCCAASVTVHAFLFEAFLSFFSPLLTWLGNVGGGLISEGGKSRVLSILVEFPRFDPPSCDKIRGRFTINRSPIACRIQLVFKTPSFLTIEFPA